MRDNTCMTPTLQVSFAKEPYKRDDILKKTSHQKRPVGDNTCMTPMWMKSFMWMNINYRSLLQNIVSFIGLFFGKRPIIINWVKHVISPMWLGHARHIDESSHTHTHTHTHITHMNDPGVIHDCHCAHKLYTYVHIYVLCIDVYVLCIYMYIYMYTYIHTCIYIHMNTWIFYFLTVPRCAPVLRLVGCLKLQVSFAKELYKRDNILQKRPIIVVWVMSCSHCA